MREALETKRCLGFARMDDTLLACGDDAATRFEPNSFGCLNCVLEVKATEAGTASHP
jgi:hypothetical protein